MKLIEALRLVEDMKHRVDAPLPCFFATGFNSLHLKTFLAAELCLSFPHQKIEISEGVYGDIIGNLRRLANNESEFGIVQMEWADLDPRLGIRSTARWTNAELSDILVTAASFAAQFQRAIEEAAQLASLIVSFPTLPLPPFSFAPGWEMSAFDLDLRAIVQSLCSTFTQLRRVRVLSSQWLDSRSPLKTRLDVESETHSGFPYMLPHTSVLAAALAQLARKPLPKKGLITDLDDTLWRGILGDDGADGISWGLEHNSQMHAFYQRFLGALANEGVLIGIASKNDPTLVREALRRSDLALSPSVIFPIEANWEPKSQAVTRILEVWNVGPESVIFVDDSPFELEEVRAVYPDMECMRFPTKNSAAIYDLTLRLRDSFGRGAVVEEDSIRMESIRRSHTEHNVLSAAPQLTKFVEHTEAKIIFDFSKKPENPRAFELVNKTNQFNLNGERYTEASWHKFLRDPNSFLLVASYQDKFGPLGKIAVMGGHKGKSRITIDIWVMSCRAFSRRIEYRCLAELFLRFDPMEIQMAYTHTERNGPLREFLNEILNGPPQPGCIVSRKQLKAFMGMCAKPQEVIHG